MSDTVCVVSADFPEERDYILGGTRGKIEAILGVEYRAGFAVDSLVHVEEVRGEILWPYNPGINKFLVQ